MDDTLKDILIPPNLEGERLDKALTTLDGALSRSTLQRLIRQGHITLNQQPVVDISLKVKAGSLFQIGIPAPQPATALPEEIPLHIVHEDAHVVVINKPPGLAVHPGAGLPSGTLVNALLHHCDSLSQPPSLTGIGGIIRPGVVHRLDKDTSGLLVVAKNDHAHLHLAAQFKEHSVTRRYLAILVGIPKRSPDRIETLLGRHPVHRQKMAVLKDKGRVAITHLEKMAEYPPLSVVRCRLETGRTHQIRVHMAHLGHPVLGDPVYGRTVHPPAQWPNKLIKLVDAFSRQALHAEILGFTHPVTGKRLEFFAPPPPDMAKVLTIIHPALKKN